MIHRRALLAAAPALAAFSSRERLLLTAQRSAPPPSLDLSFMTPGTLPSGLTFTRASTGTYFDATGTMQSATTNAPRWDYSPSALTLNGLLIEEARTNLVPLSIPIGTGWTPTNTTTAAAQGTTPDGTNTFVRITENATSTNHILLNGSAITGATVGQPYTLSVYAKMASGIRYFQLVIDDNVANGAMVTFDLSTGVISGPLTSLGSGVGLTASIVPVGGGTYRCALSANQFATATRIGLTLSNVPTPSKFPVYLGSTSNSLLLWGAQYEAGAPSSYIPTTGATVTRAADVCSAPTSTWFNAAASSLAADYVIAQSPNPSLANSRSPAGLGAGTDTNVIRLWGQLSNGSVAAISTAIAGVNTNSASLGNTTANAVMKLAGAWNGTTAVGSLNGAAAASQSIGMPAGINTLTIGNTSPGSTNYLNGWIRRVRYWNTALSAVQLQSVTT